jgi:hypothetical protein
VTALTTRTFTVSGTDFGDEAVRAAVAAAGYRVIA